MSLFSDILTDEYAGDDEIAFDETAQTWTVMAWELDGEHSPGIPDKELALAIIRAIRAGFSKGVDAAGYS